MADNSINNLKKRISALNDTQFSSLVSALAKNAGMSEADTAKLMNDLPKLRKFILTASEQELMAFLNSGKQEKKQ